MLKMKTFLITGTYLYSAIFINPLG